MIHTLTNMIRSSYESIRLFAVGFLMGSADLVPGVSGGTMALVCGIYERLLNAIKTVTGETLKRFIKGDIVGSFKSVPFSFLFPLGLGILSAIFGLAHLLSWLLEAHPVYIWSLFFGLVLASIYVVLSRTNLRHFSTISGFVLGAIFGYVLVGLVPMQTPATPLMMFVGGAIAISAMILPGISGSFMLVIMGQYQHVLSAITQRDFFVLGVFALGCIVGLSFFVRALSWLLSKYHNVTLAVLAGIMLGSLRKIWPWKEVLEMRFDEAAGAMVSVAEKNIIPPTFDTSVLIAAVLCVLGAVAVILFSRKK